MSRVSREFRSAAALFAPSAPTRPILKGLRPFDPQKSVRWGRAAQFPAPLKSRGYAPCFSAPPPVTYQTHGTATFQPRRGMAFQTRRGLTFQTRRGLVFQARRGLVFQARRGLLL